jgi:hypothetical protein
MLRRDENFTRGFGFLPCSTPCSISQPAGINAFSRTAPRTPTQACQRARTITPRRDGRIRAAVGAQVVPNDSWPSAIVKSFGTGVALPTSRGVPCTTNRPLAHVTVSARAAGSANSNDEANPRARSPMT